MMTRAAELAALEADVVTCRRCPRLVQWREQVAREKRAAYRGEDYWGRPVPGFGDPAARILLFGLAPAAHGANRTGRMFTGDRSGDFLYAALHRAGLAALPTSVARGDGQALQGVWITAAVRCAPPQNKPLPLERANCEPWAVAELALLDAVRVAVCLGSIGWEAALRARGALPGGTPVPRPRPKFGHGAEAPGDPWPLLGCFHPSQQNTFTGRLTPEMLDELLARAQQLAAR